MHTGEAMKSNCTAVLLTQVMEQILFVNVKEIVISESVDA